MALKNLTESTITHSSTTRHFSALTDESVTDATSFPGDSIRTLQDINDTEFRQRLVPVVYLILLMVIGVPGNLLALIVYTKFYNPTAHRCFILALAIVDLAVCVISLPFEVIQMKFQYTFYAETACKFFRANSVFLSMTSTLFVVCLSLNRYRSVCQPIKLQLTPPVAKVSCISAMALAFMLSWPNFVLSGARHQHFDNNITGIDCSMSDVYAKTAYPVIYTGVLFLSFIAVIFILIVIYCLIGRRVYIKSRSRRKFHPGPNSSSSNTTHSVPNSPTTVSTEGHTSTTKEDSSVSVMHKDKKDSMEPDEPDYLGQADDCKNSANPKRILTAKRNEIILSMKVNEPCTLNSNVTITEKNHSRTGKITKIAFMISLVLIFSYLPNLILTLLTAIKGEFLAESTPVVLALLPIVSRSVFINNVANPFIYGALDPKFRDGVKRLLSSRKRCR